MGDQTVQKTAPTATDVEHATDAACSGRLDMMIELQDLSCCQIGRPVIKRAGIDHQRIEPELEELVAQIVVTAYGSTGGARAGRC